MKKYCFLQSVVTHKFIILAFFLLLIPLLVSSQSSIDFSTVHNIDQGNSRPNLVKKVNGVFHTAGSSGNSFGEPYAFYHQIDATTGAPLVSKPSMGYGAFVDMEIVDGIVYLLGNIGAAGYPVTNGSTFTAPTNNYNLVYTKIDAATGTILFSTYIGGTTDDYGVGLEVANGKVYIFGTSASADFPVTNGSTLNDYSDWVYLQYDASSNNLDFSTYIGGTGTDDASKLIYDGGELLMFGVTRAPDFPVTNGSVRAGSEELVYARVNPSNGAILAASYYGGSAMDNNIADVELVGNEIYMLARSLSANYPVTIGGGYSGNTDMVVNKISRTTGNLIFSRYLGGLTADSGVDMEVSGGSVYILGSSSASNYPVTNGSTWQGGTSDMVYSKLSTTDGSLLFSTYIGGNLADTPQKIKVLGDKVFISGSTQSTNFPTTDGSSNQGGLDFVYLKLDNVSGNILDGKLIGGTQTDRLTNMVAENDVLHLFGATTIPSGFPPPASTFPTTTGETVNPFGELAYTRIDLCRTDFVAGSDILSPASQSACQNGVIGQILGEKITVPSSSLPTLYRNGVASPQIELEAAYQWQEALSAGGPWTDIPGATMENYTPQPIVVTRYYRRLARTSMCCGSVLVSTSQVAEVAINGNQAPDVNGGGLYNTCPGSPVTLNATVTGGTPAYTYDWDMGATDIEDPTVSPTEPTIYTLRVTDMNGCQQISQVLVNTYVADAGPATASVCDGDLVQIGTAPVPGLTGVVYNWSPAGGLSCTNCAQPLANPAASTTYTYSLTVPVTSGGTCTTMDNITVNPITAPSGGVFAGPDVTICRGSSATLGLAAAPGYTYTWAPGNYLTNNKVAQPTFQPGNLALPSPNPILYYVTAVNSGCTFVDEVQASVIEARAWIDGCGPRTVGEGDHTPDINEVYEWVRISGTGTITGPTNQATTTVSESVGGDSEYQLRVTHNGVTCTDNVIVPEACVCNVEIRVIAPSKCPSYGLNNGDVTLLAIGYSTPAVPPSSFIFTWSVQSGPAGGLSATTGQSVQLTDNLSRTIRVTITSSVNPNFSCFYDLEVNNPAWSLPTFSAPDVSTCVNAPIAIGAANVTDYTYQWTPSTGLSSVTVSMPTATATEPTNYSVVVTDTRSGCTVTDLVTVTTLGIIADAGPDILVCDNSTVTIGKPAQPGVTYSWSPANASWQNGTNEFSAQPEVLVAVNTTFTVTATSTTGSCITSDMVTVTVGSPVTPFTLSDIPFCPSTPPVTLGTEAPTGFASYSWSPSALLTTPTTRTTTVNTPLPTSSTTYTLLVKNTDGCEFQTTQTINPLISPPLVGGSKVICVGSSTNIGSATNPIGGGISYLWTGSGAAQLSSTTSPNPVFTPNAAGSFTFTLTKTESGCSSSANVTITVNQYTLPAIPSVTICSGASIQIGTTPVFGATYSWSPTTGLSDPNIANPVVSGLTSTTSYTLTAVGPNTCPATANVLVGVNNSAAPVITIPPVTACIGDVGVIMNTSVAPAGTYSYSWSPNNGSLNTRYSEDPEVLLFGIGTFNYTVTVTNTTNGCTSIGAASLTVDACRVISCTNPDNILLSQTAPTCGAPGMINSNGTISIQTVSNATHYGISTLNAATYDGPDYASALSLPGALPAVIQTAIPATGGTYIIRFFNDANDCIADQSVIVSAVTPPSAPVLSVTNNTCSPATPGSINVVTACGAGTFIEYSTNNGGSWSTTAPTYGTSAITVIARCVSSANAMCISASSTPVTTAPVVCPTCTNPVLTVINGAVCQGGSIDLQSLVTSAGGGALSYYSTVDNAMSASNALGSSTVSPGSATNYFIRSETGVGCYDIKKVVVTIKPTVCGGTTVTGPN